LRFSAVLPLCGCFPLIAHSPAVDSGPHVTVAAAFSQGVVRDSTRSADRIVAPAPSMTVRGSFGWRRQNDSSATAIELGGQASIANGVLADLYVQAPRNWTGAADFGLGAAYSEIAYSGPIGYAQIGRALDDRVYVFTTQAVTWMRARAQLETHRRLWWQPTVAVQPLDPDRAARFFFLTATFGPTEVRCRTGALGCLFSTPGARIAVGMAVSPRFAPRHRRAFDERGTP
jgi:hypothetical protein